MAHGIHLALETEPRILSSHPDDKWAWSRDLPTHENGQFRCTSKHIERNGKESYERKEILR